MQRVDDLTADAASALAAMLNRHFDARWRAFPARARPMRGSSAARHAPEIATTPFDAAHRRGLYPHLPRGADGGTWKRWQNEIGMLLHEHPVNVEREANGTSRSTASGSGVADGSRTSAACRRAAVTAAPGRVGDVARGIARHGGGTACEPQADDTDDACDRAGGFRAARRNSIVARSPLSSSRPSTARRTWRRSIRAGSRPLLHCCRGGGSIRSTPRRRQRRRGALDCETPDVVAAIAHVGAWATVRRAGAARIMTIVRRAVPATPPSLLAAGVSPVLARIYAARGIRDAAELDHSLAALPDFAVARRTSTPRPSAWRTRSRSASAS